MFVLGVILVIVGLLLPMPVLVTIGIVLLVVGAVLHLTHAGGRRYY